MVVSIPSHEGNRKVAFVGTIHPSIHPSISSSQSELIKTKTTLTVTSITITSGSTMSIFSIFQKNKKATASETKSTNNTPKKQTQTSASTSYPLIAPESVMNQKAHGTSNTPVQQNLRWSVDRKEADKICNFNRHYAEHFGYFRKTKFTSQVSGQEPVDFYDSNTGKPLFHILQPGGRTWKDFLAESKSHGWPSFRDDEVNWDNVRCLPNGECVSLDGTHLGHNLPDKNGNRYCINLVSIAGRPVAEEESKE